MILFYMDRGRAVAPGPFVVLAFVVGPVALLGLLRVFYGAFMAF